MRLEVIFFNVFDRMKGKIAILSKGYTDTAEAYT